MNEISTKWIQSLTCINCSMILKDPIELPCEDLICSEHLTEKSVVKQNKITCAKCQKEFKVNGEEFQINKSIQNQINNYLFLGDEGVSLKRKVEDSILTIHKMYHEFTISKTKLDLDCHDHFQEVRRLIDMHRENLKEKIDEIYMQMIEKTRECEALYLKSFNEKLDASLNNYEANSSVDDELKEMEKTFRNPNLLIESIKEMHLKQEETISIIQSNINEMSQVRENLKTSNEFKPNLSFQLNQTSFGQLNLNEYSTIDPFKSQILRRQQPLELIKLCEFNKKDRFTLLYRDGFVAKNFHSKCDGHANTLTIFKMKETQLIFGGFTRRFWNGAPYYKSDRNAFLFSLTNKDNKPCKMRIDPNKHKHAIDCRSHFGPTFGNDDLCITFDQFKNTHGFSNLGNSHKHPQYAYGTNEAKSFLAGSSSIQLSEIEVYKKE